MESQKQIKDVVNQKRVEFFDKKKKNAKQSMRKMIFDSIHFSAKSMRGGVVLVFFGERERA